jgi:DNA gyrase subunit A
MATNMAPHNLGEVVDGICAQIDNPEITIRELMQHIKGPDFPTGSTICGREPIKQYFETGRGSVKVRGKMGLEQLKGGREQIVITEIPYNVNRATLVERIAQLVNEKVLTDISYVGDQSDENTRVVIELKRDANPKVIIANLYKHTALESSFATTMLAIDHGSACARGGEEGVSGFGRCQPTPSTTRSGIGAGQVHRPSSTGSSGNASCLGGDEESASGAGNCEGVGSDRADG